MFHTARQVSTALNVLRSNRLNWANFYLFWPNSLYVGLAAMGYVDIGYIMLVLAQLALTGLDSARLVLVGLR